MPRSALIVTIFLSSPSDLAPERDFISRFVKEWNDIHGRSKSVIFEILKWEDSFSAGFGTDGQNVINKQTPSYDLLIALFWTRLGTATPRSLSGSVEEYEIALDRYRRGENIDIAFFFKDSPINWRSSDIEQLKLLKDFEEKIHGDGAFTKTFVDDENLRTELSLLFNKISEKFITSSENSQKINAGNTAQLNSLQKIKEILNDIPDEEELGLFDIIDDLNRHSSEATEILGEMNLKMNQLTDVTTKIVDEMNTISSVRVVEPSDAKPQIKKLVLAMNSYSDFIEEKLPIFSESAFSMGVDTRKLISVSYDFMSNDPDSTKNLQELQENLNDLSFGISSYNDSFLNARKATLELQRTTVEFGKSRNRMVSNMDKIIEVNGNLKNIFEQAIYELHQLMRTASSKGISD
ncbi:hypothetical protein [Sphingobium yanoikuyae]|uniref:hypothetical protein n=1 Tax=Sphingobium yanoikuyae TaxID=13690 RepID=UPI00345F08D2